MRALAHPVRLALLEVLADEGQLTATEAGEKVGESPANASFHLRQLAKYGFVEEAEGGTGRRRPWKLKHLGLRFTDVHEDPETAGAARALDRLFRDSQPRPRAARARGAQRAGPSEWRAVTGTNQFRFYLTPDELKQLDADIVKLALDRFGDRRSGTAPRPEGSERVEILMLAYRVLMRRLLAHRDARLFLAGQSLSLLGDTALWLALGLWAKDLTGSSSAAGLVILAIVAPQLLAPLGGLLVDRVRRRSLLLALNPLTALAMLPLLTVHDASDVWVIYAVSVAYGVSFMLLSAGQSALLATLVPLDLLGTANATLQTVREGLRLVAPLAGRACTRSRAAAPSRCSTPPRSSSRPRSCSPSRSASRSPSAPPSRSSARSPPAPAT